MGFTSFVSASAIVGLLTIKEAASECKAAVRTLIRAVCFFGVECEPANDVPLRVGCLNKVGFQVWARTESRTVPALPGFAQARRVSRLSPKGEGRAF